MPRATFPGTAFVLASVLVLTACSSTSVDKRSQTPLSGAELYERLCASCHGVDGRGDGPVAPAMSVRVSDLTRLAYRDGGEFPTEDVRRAIDGRWDRQAHGRRDMPVWGWQLYDMSSEDKAGARARVDSMIDRLVTYLQSIQQL